MSGNGLRKKYIISLSIILLAIIASALVINFSSINNSIAKITSTIDIDNGDEEINWNRYRYQTYDIALEDSISITKSGIYHLTGELSNGSVNVNIGPEGIVKLILDNVTISNSNGPAINCSGGDDLVIELVGENYLSDGEVYAPGIDEDAKGVLYSRADLTLEGDGALNIVATYQDGIVAKDDLKIKSGTYSIIAKDDAIRGKDSVYILNGNFILDSGADAIKSTNELTARKGFVIIKNGDFKIKSGAKGIKAINSILIYGGNFDIDSYDDSIHSNNHVGIINGTYRITSGDDGIHADNELIIDDGEIEILKSYEGLEAQAVTVNGGNISLVASDDGINAGGGADASATNRPGANNFKNNENCSIVINGGEVHINSAGDGIDSNGSIYFNGGKIFVDGPTNNNNGALDSELGITMDGGEVIALGASGMAVSISKKSTVYNISVYFTAKQPAGTKIEIKDTYNNTIMEYSSKKSFDHLSAGSEKFIPGVAYTIYLNDEKYQEFTLLDVTTIINNPNMNMNQKSIPRR